MIPALLHSLVEDPYTKSSQLLGCSSTRFLVAEISESDDSGLEIVHSMTKSIKACVLIEV